MRSISESHYLSDIGNTNVKIWRDGQTLSTTPINIFKPEDFTERVFYISVNRNFSERVKSLQNWIDISNLFHIQTEYRTLGVDRVVALYGVENGIVVDVGSAVTVDVIKESKHLGGYILLGKEATWRAFQDKTPHLNINKSRELNIDEVPLLSGDAIYYGFYHSISSLVISLKSRFNLPVTITGGDGEELSYLIEESIFKSDLLFLNMEKIIARD